MITANPKIKTGGADEVAYAKVLIVDTNIEFCDASIGFWAGYGIKINRVDTIECALEELMAYKYQLIVIVEGKEPRAFALESIRLFRELTLAPVILVSAEPINAEYRIAVLNIWADKVWETHKTIEDIAAKGDTLVRRYLQLNKEIDRQPTVTVNNHIVMSTAQRLVYIKGVKVELTRIEFDILALLIAHPGRVFTYDLIFDNVWGDEFEYYEKSVLRNQIHKLRNKLKVDSSVPLLIKRHQGLGYSFTPEYDR